MPQLFQRWLLALTLLFTLMLGLTSCSGVAMKQVVVAEPALLLEQYFLGKTRAYGVLLDRSGAATRHFVVDIVGTWDAAQQTLVLDEQFAFNDGERSERIWTIVKEGPNRYRGTAADVVGVAQGEVKGNVFNWHYVLAVPYKGRTLNIHFDDWMFLSADNVLINKAVMRKFGFKVGEVLISFKK